MCQIDHCLSITWRGRLREGFQGLRPMDILFIVARVIDLSGNQRSTECATSPILLLRFCGTPSEL